MCDEGASKIASLYDGYLQLASFQKRSVKITRNFRV